MARSWNTTIVTLIPKVKCPSHPGDFRPISCCHVLFKFISKLINSRLKLVLGSIIDPTQGPFVTDRSIMHNILLCQDLLKQYSRYNCAANCLIKIELCKSYDTMDWKFLRDMLVALNFLIHFIRIIMAYITSTSYTLMINGYPTPPFQAKRGLRQGDPLSPLLFVIGMEYLSRSLKSVEDRYGFHPQCRRTKLTHLCFADDLMLFCKEDISSVRVFYECIQSISQASGFKPMPLSQQYMQQVLILIPSRLLVI